MAQFHIKDHFEEDLMKFLSPHGVDSTKKQEKTKIKSVVPQIEPDTTHLDLQPNYGINLDETKVLRNPSASELYECALKYEKGTAISSTGALICSSGERTGRSPKDKRIVDEPSVSKDIWWGPVNTPISSKAFMINRERAIDFLNMKERLYVLDAWAGWEKNSRLKVRVICARAYHCLFMRNMLVLPTESELIEWGTPDFTVYNSGEFPANRHTEGMTSATSIALSFERKEMVILGSQYAGEMKKGILSVIHYYMPKKGILSLHSSANVGKAEEDDVSVFFGLSGTGKTTLSADINRQLIGDDEICWTDEGVFNVEGGCYAKCINLSRDSEPEIYDAIRFGSVLENVVFDPVTREVDYDDDSITVNTRTSYPIGFIPNAKIPCVATHPKTIVMLTCDAFGVLPPVSRLSENEGMFHFVSGYTAKVAGTEMGVSEPEATFSACFGDAFLVLHPSKYAEMLAEKCKKHGSKIWLVNTGWCGGKYGVGSRIKLKYTRAIIDAITNDTLSSQPTEELPYFKAQFPTKCDGVPDELMTPWKTWKNKSEYDGDLKNLASMFLENFKKFSDKCSDDIIKAAPKI